MSARRRFCGELDLSGAHLPQQSRSSTPRGLFRCSKPSQVPIYICKNQLFSFVNWSDCPACCFRLSCSTWAGFAMKIKQLHPPPSLSGLGIAGLLLPPPLNHCYDTRIRRPNGESYKKKNSPVEKQSFSCIFPRWQLLVYMHIKLYGWLQSFWVD